MHFENILETDDTTVKWKNVNIRDADIIIFGYGHFDNIFCTHNSLIFYNQNTD